jgi:hypothetical protein
MGIVADWAQAIKLAAVRSVGRGRRTVRLGPPAADAVPVGVDTNRPSVARVYDYLLGGHNNFVVDRQVAERAIQVNPDAPAAALASRAFVQRAVRYLASEAGIRQFLVLGSGLPTQGNVHEVARAIDRRARVVYVDNDPMVLVHSRALLARDSKAIVVQADIREPDLVLTHPDLGRHLDFKRPIGLLLLAILHHFNDHEDPAGIARRYREALPSGSYVAVSHFVNPGEENPAAARRALTVEKLFADSLGTGRFRMWDEILGYFGDFDLVEPGLVPLPEWRPDPWDRSQQSHTYSTFVGGVGRKR